MTAAKVPGHLKPLKKTSPERNWTIYMGTYAFTAIDASFNHLFETFIILECIKVQVSLKMLGFFVIEVGSLVKESRQEVGLRFKSRHKKDN